MGGGGMPEGTSICQVFIVHQELDGNFLNIVQCNPSHNLAEEGRI